MSQARVIGVNGLPSALSGDAAFRELLEAAPDAIVIVDHLGRIVLLNRQAESSFGYLRSDLLGQQIEVLLPAQFRELHLAYRAQYQQSPRMRAMGVGLSFVGRRRDGSEFPLEISLSPLAIGGHEFVITIARDVTARTRAEEAAHHRLKQIVDQLPDGLLILDSAGHCTISNPASAEMLGFDPTVDGLPGPSVESPALRSLLSGEVVRSEQLVVRNPSTLREVSLLASSAPLRDQDGHIAGAVLSLRDISVQTSAERENEQLLQSVTHILDGVSDAIVALDSSGCITRVNPAAAALLGRPGGDVVGRAARDVFQWEDDAGRVLDEEEYLFRRTVATRARVTADNRYYRKPDGTRIPVEISSTLVADSRGRVEMVVQVIRDLTRVREVERLKNQILSLVSHELRTPIAHIKGFATSLLEPDITWDAATQREFLSDIDREANRLSGLVADLLDMSRIEAGLPVTEMLELSPAALTWRALHDVHWAISEHDVKIDVPDDLPEVVGNGAHLERVLGNLLQNAAKYSDPGSRIDVQASIVDLAACWSVSDRGPGIPIDYRERIFEKFVRVPGVSSRTSGIGLGLPISRAIVEAHGGRLWLESPVGGGCRFIFTIPLARAYGPTER